MLQATELLKMATTFDLGEGYKIERRTQLGGNQKWCVSYAGQVLNKEGYFEYEPSPSNRTDDFIESTRFDSPQQAYKTFQEASKHLNL